MGNVKVTKEFLTDGQRKVLEFIQTFILNHGYAPTWREIAGELNMKRSNVQYHLTILEQKKYIKTPGRKFRNLRIV